MVHPVFKFSKVLRGFNAILGNAYIGFDVLVNVGAVAMLAKFCV